jgi:hypothetical protein
MRVNAVRVLSVLAGGNFLCGFFAAKTSPVSKSAITYEIAEVFGGAEIPSPSTELTITPLSPRRPPPIDSFALESPGSSASGNNKASAMTKARDEFVNHGAVVGWEGVLRNVRDTRQERID